MVRRATLAAVHPALLLESHGRFPSLCKSRSSIRQFQQHRGVICRFRECVEVEARERRGIGKWSKVRATRGTRREGLEQIPK